MKTINTLLNIPKFLAQQICWDIDNTHYLRDFEHYFNLYRDGKHFSLYHFHKSRLPKNCKWLIELAIMTGEPLFHLHLNPGVGWFYFLDDNGGITYGGIINETEAVATPVKLLKHTFYPVAPGVGHAAFPWDHRKPTHLIILNPPQAKNLISRNRPEGKAYTDDSLFINYPMRNPADETLLYL